MPPAAASRENLEFALTPWAVCHATLSRHRDALCVETRESTGHFAVMAGLVAEADDALALGIFHGSSSSSTARFGSDMHGIFPCLITEIDGSIAQVAFKFDLRAHKFAA